MKEKTVRRLLIAADILWIAFIFLHSLQTAEISSRESEGLLTVLRNIFPFLTEFLLRKAGHFLEFFVLGILFSLTAGLMIKPEKQPALPKGFSFFVPLCAGLFIAACDEMIQLGVEGRSGELLDVLIDFCGVLCAVLLVFLPRRFLSRRTDK